MLRLSVYALACLGALAAAVPHVAPHVDVVVPAPPQPPVIPAVSAESKKAAAEPATVALPLTKILTNGQRYFVGDISVGTPGQPMTVTVDIGSRLSYVPSVKCTDTFCTSHKQYDSAASSTYQADGTAFELPYGQNASGVLSRDALTVSGATAQVQTIGEALAVWNEYSEQAPNDGVLGVGFGAPAGEGEYTGLLDTMTQQGVIGQRLAGLWLSADAGELTLGGLSAARYSGELAWTPALLNPDGWAVAAGGISVGATSLCSSDNCFISVVTTTPYFMLRMERAAEVNAALGGQDIGQPGVAVLDCATLYTLPTLQLEIAGRKVEMSPLEYTFILPLGAGVEMCISGFVGGENFDDNFMLLGTMFLQKFYTAYDMDNMRVAIADSA